MVPPQATHDIELGAGEEVGIVLVHEVEPSRTSRASSA